MEIEGMDQEIARLRLLVAVLKGKQDELRAQTLQFSQQLERARNVAVRGHPLDASLTMMAEIQERLDTARVTLEHLETIGARAEAEFGGAGANPEGRAGEERARVSKGRDILR